MSVSCIDHPRAGLGAAADGAHSGAVLDDVQSFVQASSAVSAGAASRALYALTLYKDQYNLIYGGVRDLHVIPRR